MLLLCYFECAPRCSAHDQRKNYFYYRVCRALRSATNAFSREGELPQSKPDGFASSLGEGASGETGNFALEPGSVPLCQGPHPRGGWHRAAMTGGVSSRRGRGCCPCAAEPFPRNRQKLSLAGEPEKPSGFDRAGRSGEVLGGGHLADLGAVGLEGFLQGS